MNNIDKNGFNANYQNSQNSAKPSITNSNAASFYSNMGGVGI